MDGRVQSAERGFERSEAAASDVAGGGPSRRDLLLCGLVVAVTLAIFAPSLTGQWVYDDTSQIVGNHLIQEPRFYATALLSDVWAFSRDPERAASNYWRPTFMLWLIIHAAVFGVTNPLGWHLTNILLHAAVVTLAFVILRQLKLSALVAAAITMLYALHPSHVESVTWVSGSPNMLVALPLLGALSAALEALRRPRLGLWVLSLCLFAVAQLAKEMAILFPLILAGVVFVTTDPTTPRPARLRRSIRLAAPFVVAAALLLIARFLVLGGLEKEYAFRPGYFSMLLTAPSILVFYLRQTFLPFWIQPAYALRPVQPEDVGLAEVWLPLSVVGSVALIVIWLVRRRPVGQIGLLLWTLPLLPALNINAFPPEEIVHDRYLYLPLIGALMVLVPPLIDGLSRLVARQRAERILAVALGLCCLPLAALTLRYEPTWKSELALWDAAVESDPTSSSAWAQYGAALYQDEQPDEARRALDRSISIHPLTTAYLGRAELSIRQGRYDEAEDDLQAVLSQYGDFYKAFERLALLYQEQQRWTDAENTLREAREKIGYRYCELTAKLAVVLYQDERKAQALIELEGVRDRVDTEGRPGAKEVYLRLGQLYVELGRPGDARAALKQYLTATERASDSLVVGYRSMARRLLGSLPEDHG